MENKMIWLAIALIICVYIICDTWTFSKGIDTPLFSYKTPKELELQQTILDNLKRH